MRINNVSQETSSQLVVIMSIITFIMTVGFISAYIFSSEISFLGFFQWLFSLFQALRAESTDEPYMPWLILGLIIAAYGGFVGAIISRHNALARFNSGLNIKYINFLEGRIEFFFTRPEYNFVCAYSDIEKLYMDLQSTLVHTKHGSYIAFQQMNLTFTALNGKKFELSNTTSSPMKLIYQIIDWTRGIQQFDYGFSGYGEIPDFKEKIDEYLQCGYKDIVGKEGETKLKWLSLIFFIMGTVFAFAFRDMVNDIVQHPALGFIFIPFSFFFIISFIFDIILVVDKIRDNNFRGHNG